jgi:hypothetical protein
LIRSLRVIRLRLIVRIYARRLGGLHRLAERARIAHNALSVA